MGWFKIKSAIRIWLHVQLCAKPRQTGGFGSCCSQTAMVLNSLASAGFAGYEGQVTSRCSSVVERTIGKGLRASQTQHFCGFQAHWFTLNHMLLHPVCAKPRQRSTPHVDPDHLILLSWPHSGACTFTMSIAVDNRVSAISSIISIEHVSKQKQGEQASVHLEHLELSMVMDTLD